MKNVLVFILTLCLLFCVCACSDKTDETASVNSTFEKPNYQFYTDFSYNNNGIENINDFKSVDELKLGLGRDKIIIDTVQTNKTVIVDKDSIELVYQGTYVSDKDNLVFDNYNRAFHTYMGTFDNKANVTVMYRNNTDELCFYSSIGERGSTVKFSEADYEKISLAELDKRLPDGWNETYSECDIEINQNLRWVIATFYRANIYGYKFRESLLVYVDFDGNVIAFDVREYGLFDQISELVTQKEIDSAYTAIADRIIPKGTKYNLSTPLLHIDNEGNLFMSSGYSDIDEDGNKVGAYALVNVK